MTTEFQGFDLDSTLELVGDQFTVAFVGSEPLRTKTKTDTVTITVGFLDPNGNPLVLSQIVDGPTDEFEVVVTPEAITGSKRGRDAGAKILDQFFKKRYRRLPVAPVLESAAAPPGPTIPEETGQFSAKQIAEEAVASTGLSLVWGVRDYILMQDFTASGRVIDTLRTLIRPWTWLEPYKADITIQGTTVVIRARDPATLPETSLTLAEARRSSMTIRVRRTRKYGTVTLRGRAEASELVPNPDPTIAGVGSVSIQGEQTETKTDEAFGPTGELISRVTTTGVYGMPSHNLLRQTRESYGIIEGSGLTLIEREQITNQWEAVAIDTAGPVQQNIQKAQLATTHGFDEDGIWRITGQKETGYAYDTLGFLSGQSTLTKAYNSETLRLEDNELVVKTLRDIDSLLVEQTTETYAYQEVEVPGFGTSRRAVIQHRETQTQGGHRPGGPGRGKPRHGQLAAGVQSAGGAQPIELSQTISSDADAVDIEESDPNLTADDLAYLMAQFVAASDLWEYEVLFDGVNMPWIHRGMYLQITEIPSEIVGVFIDLPVLLVTEVLASYNEASAEAKSTVKIRAFGWRAT